MTPAEQYDVWAAERARQIALLPSNASVAQARQAACETAALNDDTSRCRVRRTTHVRSDLPVEITQPATEVIRLRARYTVLHVHGAAQTGSAESYQPLAAQIAMGIPATVFMLDYRRPPEARFPAVVEDVVDALSWLEGCHHPMRRVIISGDSFGAMPVLTAVMRRRDAGKPMPAGIYLLCPDTIYTNRASLAGRPYDPNPETCIWTDGLNQYFPPTHPCDGPDASPGLQNLAGLPPILMHESRKAPLTHALQLRDSLMAIGADITFQDWPDTPHIFPAYGAAFSYTVEAMASLRAWVNGTLG